MDKVSIIVPVYNGEQHIAKCIDSLLGQTHPSVEIIAVNDGSKDNSLGVLRRYEGRITVVDKPNGGVANARNVALAHVTGDYVMFVDSDDWLEEDCVAQMLANSQQADIIRIKLKYCYMSGKTRMEGDDFPSGQLMQGKALKKVYRKMLTGIGLNTVIRTMYRWQVVQHVRFREDLQTGEDLIYNVDAFSQGPSFIYLKELWYNYYQTNQGLTGSGLKVLEKYRCNFQISGILIGHLPRWHMADPFHFVLAAVRPLTITISKLYRRNLNEKSA